MPAQIQKVLMLSTAHAEEWVINGAVKRLFKGHDTVPHVVASYDHGRIFWVPEAEEEESDKVPESLRLVFKAARFMGCGLVRFDGDGPLEEGLPTYTWE